MLPELFGATAIFLAGTMFRDGRLIAQRDQARAERDMMRDAFREADDRYVILRDAVMGGNARVLGAAERIAALSVPVELYDQDKD